jgi:hypothetical protein
MAQGTSFNREEEFAGLDFHSVRLYEYNKFFFSKKRPVFPGKCRIFPGGCSIFPGGCRICSGKRRIFPGGCSIFPGKCRIFPDGRRVFPGGWALFPGKVYNRRGVPARKFAGEKGIRDVYAAFPFSPQTAGLILPFTVTLLVTKNRPAKEGGFSRISKAEDS